MPYPPAFLSVARVLRKSYLSAMSTVVIADGDRDTRDLYQEFLSANGWDVLQAATGEEASFYCKERHPDILLTEVALPGLDGIGVCRTIRSTAGCEGLPILVLTAVSHPHYLVRAKCAGANRILVKPATPDQVEAELLHMVERWPTVLDRAAALRHAASSLAATLASAPHDVYRTKIGWELLALTADDGMEIGALLSDRAGFCLGSNPVAAELIGCSRDELVTRSIWDALPPQRRMESRAIWRWFLDAGEMGGTVTVVTGDGERRDLQYTAIADVVHGAHLSVFAPHALGTAVADTLPGARR